MHLKWCGAKEKISRKTTSPPPSTCRSSHLCTFTPEGTAGDRRGPQGTAGDRRGPQVYQSLCELQLATLHTGCEAPQGTGVHECNCTTGSSALTISFSLHLWCTIFANLCTFGASGVSHFLFFDEQSGMNITTTPLHFPAKGLIPCTYGAPRASVLSEISRGLIYIIDAYSAPYRYIFFSPKGLHFLHITTPLHFPAEGMIPCIYGAPRASPVKWSACCVYI